jgi:hypothetical protein
MILDYRVRILLLLTFLLMGAAEAAQPAPAAPHELAGPWRGPLQVDPATTLTVEFTFTLKPDGTYSAVLNSLDNETIKNVPADHVTWHDSALEVRCTALSGSYGGVLQNGRIEGRWSQPGSVLPLVLTPYSKPQLSKAEMEKLLGAWNGRIGPGAESTLVARFSLGEGGELRGVLAIQAEGGQQHSLTRLELTSERLSFTVPDLPAQYHAAYTNGAFTGPLSRPGVSDVPVTLTKGELPGAFYALKLPADIFSGLLGSWHGTLQITAGGQHVSLPLVMRWFVNSHAQMVGFIDNPSQKALGIPVTEATFAAGKLTLKLGSLNAQYEAERSGATWLGRWTQGGTGGPLTFKKD